MIAFGHNFLYSDKESQGWPKNCMRLCDRVGHKHKMWYIEPMSDSHQEQKVFLGTTSLVDTIQVYANIFCVLKWSKFWWIHKPNPRIMEEPVQGQKSSLKNLVSDNDNCRGDKRRLTLEELKAILVHWNYIKTNPKMKY